MSNPFTPAVKSKSHLRLAIDGPAGSGKTYTALVAATAFAKAINKKIALIESEKDSAQLYAKIFTFDCCALDSYDPQKYIDLIHAAEKYGYGVIIIDSLSHAWMGEGGVLDIADRAKAKNYGNSWSAWKDATPIQRKLIDTILNSSCHIIATIRTKTEWVVETNEKGKPAPRKVGLAPVQRADIDYEFTIFAEMDHDHNFMVSKTRCDLVDNAVVNKPDEAFFSRILDWLNEGIDVPVVVPTQPTVTILTPDPVTTPIPVPATKAPAPAATVTAPISLPATTTTPAAKAPTPAAPATKTPAPIFSVEHILTSHKVSPGEALTITGAKSLSTSGNPPKRYGDMTQEELCQAFTAMSERVKNPQGGTNAAVLGAKMDGIWMILAEMNGANTQAPVSTLVPTQPAEEVQESLI